MSRESVLLILTIVVILTPFLGLPYSWIMVVIPVLGFAILGIGVTLRIRRTRSKKEVSDTPEYEGQNL